MVIQGPRHLLSCGSPIFNTEDPKLLGFSSPSHGKEKEQGKSLVGILYAPERTCCIPLLLTGHWLVLSHMITLTSREPAKCNEACTSASIKISISDLLASLFLSSAPCLLHGEGDKRLQQVTQSFCTLASSESPASEVRSQDTGVTASIED